MGLDDEATTSHPPFRDSLRWVGADGYHRDHPQGSGGDAMKLGLVGLVVGFASGLFVGAMYAFTFLDSAWEKR